MPMPAPERSAMQYKEILQHRSGAKVRIYAKPLSGRELTVITTVGGDHADAADDLAVALGIFLHERDDQALDTVLERLPEAVRLSVKAFTSGIAPLELGDRDDLALIEDWGCSYHFGLSEELIEYLESADTVGLGVRMENLKGSDGDTQWKVTLRSAVPLAPYDAEPRAWGIPSGHTLDQTWSSIDRLSSGTGSAVAIAGAASDEGKYVRVHTFWRPDGPDENGTMTLEYVVDIFDAPIPVKD